jgi:hypothetical protein
MRSVLILSVICLFALGASAQTAHLPSQFQSWNEVQLIVPLTYGKDAKSKRIDKVTATFSGVGRFARNSADIVDWRLGVTIDYRLNRYVSFLTAVLYRKDEAIKNARSYETRLNFGAVFSKTFHNFTVRDRSMFEHRFRNSRSDTELYRNRIQISRPVKFNKKEQFSLFISDEGYYEFQSRAWTRNEFNAGITRRLNDRTAVDISYVRADTRPVNINGISMNLRIKLR